VDESDFILCLSMDFGIRGVHPSDSAFNAIYTVLIEILVLLL
jgi:hypothetical protein